MKAQLKEQKKVKVIAKAKVKAQAKAKVIVKIVPVINLNFSSIFLNNNNYINLFLYRFIIYNL